MRIDEKQMECAIAEVRGMISASLRRTTMRAIADELVAIIGSGKMLRVRMMLRVGAVTGASVDTLTRASAAIELVHAASLMHDDVIDNAVLRRGLPAFWVTKGTAGAVLLGDLLVCQAFKLVSESKDRDRLVPVLISQAGEMCEAETEQELLMKGQLPDWQTCVSLARRKTGSLFAFAGYASGGRDNGLCAALREAGYAAGTAYQLADDLLDAYGDPGLAGKTLGSDATAGKVTAASAWRLSGVDPSAYIEKLLADSEKHLEAWPAAAAAWRDYLETDLNAAVESFIRLFPAQVV